MPSIGGFIAIGVVVAVWAFIIGYFTGYSQAMKYACNRLDETFGKKY